MNKAIVIGAGIGGIASALRLTKKGFKVTVFDSNNYPGGKITSLKLGKYRFDAGPPLLTMPNLIDDLFLLFNEDPSEFFNYNSEIESQSVVLTSYDFSNLQINLSTDTVGFTGSTDSPSFTIELSSTHDNGRLLDNLGLLNFRVVDSFNLSASDPRTLFDRISAFKRFPHSSNNQIFQYWKWQSRNSARSGPRIRANSARNDNCLRRFSYFNSWSFWVNCFWDRYKPSKRCSCYPNHSHEQIKGKANLV